MSPTPSPHPPDDESGAYAVLGLTPPVSQADVRHAFRRRLREHHPDTRLSTQPLTDQQRRSADLELQRILSAYETLQHARLEAASGRDTADAGDPSSHGYVRVTSPARVRPDGPALVATPVRWTPPADQREDSPARRIPAGRELGRAYSAGAPPVSVIYIWRLSR